MVGLHQRALLLLSPGLYSLLTRLVEDVGAGRVHVEVKKKRARQKERKDMAPGRMRTLSLFIPHP